jgi:multidrug resistance protein, MATE family
MGIWGWWAFDIFTLIASYLSVDEVSAQTIMRTLGLLTFMIPVGFSQASVILVGKSIGEANVPAIRQYYTLCMYLSVAVAFA